MNLALGRLQPASEVVRVAPPTTSNNDRVAQLLVKRGDRYLISILFQQALILAILGFVPGYAISLGLYGLIAQATLLPVSMSISRAILVFVMTLVMCIASGSIATRKLQSADPADIF